MLIDKGNYKLYKGDCLEVMDGLIALGVKFDAIICDLPYGTTKAKWDSMIPLDRLWNRYERLIKKDGAIVLFGSQPFTSKLINSKEDWFKEEIIWKKDRASNFANAKHRHLKYHENIVIFSNGKHTYNRQMQPRKNKRVEQMIKNGNMNFRKGKRTDGTEISFGTDYKPRTFEVYDAKFKNPMSVIENPIVVSTSKEKLPHPTQKPLKLMDYLIKTYTNELDLILDNTMGVGSTIVSAINNNRRAVGIELDDKYFNIAKERLENLV